MEPLNSNDVGFALNFINNFEGRFTIDEPINFSGLNFFLEQLDGRYGRDASFAKGEFDIEFDSKGNQNESQLPLLLEYNTDFGFESQVEFIVVIYGIDYVIGLLDFQSASTDGFTYLKIKVIQESQQALLKRRSDIKIDMFSGVDLNGDVIAPLTTQNLFLPAKTVVQESQWIASANFGVGGIAPVDFNFINVIQQSGIENTLSYFLTFDNGEFARYIEAQNDLQEVLLRVSSFGLIQSGGATSRLVYKIGLDFATATEIELEDFGGADVVNFSDTYVLNDMAKGETLWIYIAKLGGIASSSVGQVGSTFNISVNATPISTITPSFSLQSIITQIVLSTTGMTTTFSPDFLEAIEDERCFNGLQLRGFNPDNAYVSFDDIKAWMDEINADYQIIDNTEVFFGLYADFYADFEIGSNTVAPNADFKITYNPRYTVNKLGYKYDKFEDDKNTENNNAIFSIHTESQWNLPNLQVENKKEIDIPFIRDAFLIESVRTFNSQAKNETSTKSDEDIFIVDLVPNQLTANNEYNFSAFVQVDGTEVTFLNDASFSFIATGIEVLTNITFDADNGDFTGIGEVQSVTATEVTIDDGGLSGIENGQYLVNFSFSINTFVARTNQGITNITNDGADGEGFVNLLYSPKRNILNYWGAYLNTACSFSQDGTITKTFYKNNEDLTTFRLADGLGVLQEGGDILVSSLNSRVLSPYIVETTILADFTEFQDIVANLRSDRGYLSIADNNGNVLQVYPQLLDYNWEDNSLRVIGEQRV